MVYKNGIPYDISYQVESEGAIPLPNTLDKVTEVYNVGLDVDNTWLPYFKIINGQINLVDCGFWNSAVKSIYFEPTDVPVISNLYGDNNNIEQMYIKNDGCRWGASDRIGSFCAIKYSAFIDNNATTLYNSALAGPRGKHLIVWTPNNGVVEFNHMREGAGKTVVVNATDIAELGENGGLEYSFSKIYLNKELHEKMLAKQSSNWDDNYEPNVIEYDAEETEWLDNYFSIQQDGQTLPWYTSNIENVFGKYLRLKSNNNIIEELLYWELDTIITDIEQNLTDSPVTRTGTITYGSLSKNYSITLSPMDITVKARLYFNTESGAYSRFSVWPYRYDNWVGYDWEVGEDEYNRWSTALKSIKILRYKPVNSSIWTTYTIPTPKQLLDDRGNWWEYVNLSDMISLNIDNDGYYDVEWVIDYAQVLSVIGGESYQFMLRNKKVSSDKQSISENADTQDDTHPYELSCTYHNDYLYYGHMAKEWWEREIYNTIFNNLYEAPCYTRTGVLKDFVVEWGPFGGWESNTYLKDIVYENCTGNTEIGGLIYVDNDEFSTDGTLWYASSDRIPFNDTSICGVRPAPHTIYLHPTIYAMTNHGFDDTVRGWESSVLDEFLNNGGQLYELPNNWRELVPNYIG